MSTAKKPTSKVQITQTAAVLPAESVLQLACCGTFHAVHSLPWTCPTCNQTHLGDAPLSFADVVAARQTRIGEEITSLQQQIAALKAAMHRAEQQQAALQHYLDLDDAL